MNNVGMQEKVKVQAMFGRVAPRYDLLNSLLSGGQDRVWRRFLTEQVLAQQPRPRRLLDVATGSGEVLKSLRAAKAFTETGIGADFSQPMLEMAHKKEIGPLVTADGLRLPFADGSFDAVTIAFGLRNLEDRVAGLREMHRVLAPGGKLYILEFSHPVGRWAAFYFFYLRAWLPGIAASLGAPRQAYTYLGDSIRAFPNQEALAALLRANGFAEVTYWNRLGGVVALHSARKTA